MRDSRGQDLGHLHLLEDLDGKVLEAADVDRALLAGLEVASTDAEVRGRADHAASEAEGVVREDGSCSTIVVLGRDTPDERLDVELGGAGLLAGGVGAFEAPGGLPQCTPLAQCRVFNVIEVLE